MAYDAMGNYIGDFENTTSVYETEEERRKREQAEAKKRGETVATEEKVIQYEDGSKTVETKREVPAGAVNTTVQGPVDPAEVFKRMQVIESGNRDYDKQGRPIQSPVGAMYKNQVMPATAANPGYGITPARDNSPEEYNRVGQEYFQAMLKQFGGDTQKAAAAYNAGPGRVQQNMRANQGEMNVAQLPRETQGYLQKLGNLVGSVIPSAQAAPAPQNVRAQAYPQEGVAVATGRNGVQGTQTIMGPVSPEQVQQQAQNELQGLEQYRQTQQPQPEPQQPQQQPIVQRDDEGNTLITNPDGTTQLIGANGQPMLAGGQQPTDTQQYRDRLFTDAGEDPMKWLQISQDQTQTQAIRKVAAKEAQQRLKTTLGLEDAKAQVEQTVAAAAAGDPKASGALAKAMTSKSEEGSFFKMVLMGFISPQLAGLEAAKLGLGATWRQVSDKDGNTAMVKFRADGLPMSGISSNDKDLTDAELTKFASAGATQKGVEVEAGTYMDPTGKVSGNWVLERKPGGSVYRQVGTGKIATEEQANSLRKTSVAGTLADQLASQRQKLQEQTRFMAPQEALKVFGRFDAENKTTFAEEYKAQNPQYFTPEGAVKPGPTVQPGTAGAPQGSATSVPGNQQLPANTTAPTTSQAASAPTGNSPADITSAREQKKREDESKLKMGEKQTEGIIKHVNDNIVPASMAATDGSDAVKRQFKIINDPTSNALFGLYNKAQSNSASDKNWAIVRDWLGGKLDPNENTKISEALAKVKLNSDESSQATLYLQDQTRLANAMIKSGVYGSGASISSSDRESAEKAQLDINTNPALAVFAGKSQQLFGFDVNRAKMDWAADKNYATVAQMERAWSKEQAKLVQQYGKVADERNAFIKANSNNEPATIGLVRKAYQMYPVPQYDPNLNNNNGGWRNMRDRKLEDILKGNQ